MRHGQDRPRPRPRVPLPRAHSRRSRGPTRLFASGERAVRADSVPPMRKRRAHGIVARDGRLCRSKTNEFLNISNLILTKKNCGKVRMILVAKTP